MYTANSKGPLSTILICTNLRQQPELEQKDMIVPGVSRTIKTKGKQEM